MTAAPQYSSWTLENGLRVLHAYRPWNRTFAASLGFNAGWCDEDKRHRGLTHLIEHLAFAGGNRSLVETLSLEGLAINGVTEWEQTFFPASGHEDLFPLLVQFYAGVLRGLEFDDEALKDELAIIVQELFTLGDTPIDLELRKITARILGDPSLGSPFPTNVRNLKRLTLDEIREYARERFSAANAVLTVVSPRSPDSLKAQLEEALGRIAPVPRPARPELPPELLGQNHLVRRYYPAPQILMVVSYAYRPRDRYPMACLAMLNELVGNGYHSLLFRAMRREAQMSYDHGTSLSIVRNTVLFQATAVVAKRDGFKALREIIECLAKLRAEGIDAETMALAKRRMIHGLDSLEDDSSHLCEWLAHEAFLSDEELPSPEHYQSLIQNLSLDEFNEAVRQVLHPDLRTTSILGAVRLPLRWRARRLLRNDERNV